MSKKYNPYAIMLLTPIFLLVTEPMYARVVFYGLYLPCLIFLIELWGKAKMTKNLLIASGLVMVFAIIAQIIGLDTVWKLPEQKWIFNDWVLFPIEELGYWHGSMLLAIFIYKHLEVYHGDLVSNLHIRLVVFIGRVNPFQSYSIRAKEKLARLILTSVIFALYMYLIESYSLYHGFFQYFDSQITFYLGLVPFEGFLMYFAVPYFFFAVFSLVKSK